jgi:hypothetical protein
MDRMEGWSLLHPTYIMILGINSYERYVHYERTLALVTLDEQ